MRKGRTRPPPRARAGFTLVETGLVVAIVGLLAAMAFSGLAGVRGRAAGRNALLEVSTALRQARAEAFGRGAPVVFVLEPAGPAPAALRWVTFVDANEDFDPAGAANEGPGDAVLARSALAETVAFEAASSPVLASQLPAPLAAFPATKPCSFCEAGSTRTVVVFASDGTARLGREPYRHELGGTFTLGAWLGGAGEAGRLVERMTVAILPRTGAVYALERK